MWVTFRRAVATAGMVCRIGTVSYASRGNTSRNQPTAPAIESTAPRALIEMLVTKPAKSSVTPKARTIGHAVGAGISSVVLSVAISAPDDVDDCEDDDPHYVDEVPIERQHVQAFAVFGARVSTQREQ